MSDDDKDHLDQNDFGELEEVQEIEPLESAEQIYRGLIKEYPVQYWTKNYIKSPLPLLLLNNNLLIIWANLKFQELYGNFRDFLGQHITHFYSNSFDENRRILLLKNIRSR